jgi:hypothetical protein
MIKAPNSFQNLDNLLSTVHLSRGSGPLIRLYLRRFYFLPPLDVYLDFLFSKCYYLLSDYPIFDTVQLR